MLGPSTVAVPRFGFGTASLGNLFTSVSPEVATATLNAAHGAGLTYLDTAPHYGVGLAEERVGAWLAPRDRSSVVMSTKVGRLVHEVGTDGELDGQGFVDTPRRSRSWDFSGEGIRRSLQESCQRLGVRSIDLALLHDPDDHRSEAFATAMPELVRMREEGVVRAIGAGMNQAQMLTDLVEAFPLDAVLCAGRYTLLEQGALNNLLPACQGRGTSIIIGGVYNSGLLTNPAPGATYDYAEASPTVIEKAKRLDVVCDRFGVPLKAAAAQFPLAHPAVACVLVSGNSPQQVADNVRMIDYLIPDELWAALREEGLIDDRAPTPVRADPIQQDNNR